MTDGSAPRVLFRRPCPHGLLIPQEAFARAKAAGLPGIEPHLWSYATLLKLGDHIISNEPGAASMCVRENHDDSIVLFELNSVFQIRRFWALLRDRRLIVSRAAIYLRCFHLNRRPRQRDPKVMDIAASAKAW